MFTAAAAALMITASAQPANPDNDRHEGRRARLVGTWSITVSIQDCHTGAPLGKPFYALLSFAAGGTMSGATSNPAFQAGQRSPDFGVWRQSGPSTYHAVDESLILFAAGPFTPGTQMLIHEITVSADGDQFTDSATTQFADFTGASVSPPAGCASATGQRVH
jgi:hypothetical protein